MLKTQRRTLAILFLLSNSTHNYTHAAATSIPYIIDIAQKTIKAGKAIAEYGKPIVEVGTRVMTYFAIGLGIVAVTPKIETTKEDSKIEHAKLIAKNTAIIKSTPATEAIPKPPVVAKQPKVDIGVKSVAANDVRSGTVSISVGTKPQLTNIQNSPLQKAITTSPTEIVAKKRFGQKIKDFFTGKHRDRNYVPAHQSGFQVTTGQKVETPTDAQTKTALIGSMRQYIDQQRSYGYDMSQQEIRLNDFIKNGSVETLRQYQPEKMNTNIGTQAITKRPDTTIGSIGVNPTNSPKPAITPEIKKEIAPTPLPKPKPIDPIQPPKEPFVPQPSSVQDTTAQALGFLKKAGTVLAVRKILNRLNHNDENDANLALQANESPQSNNKTGILQGNPGSFQIDPENDDDTIQKKTSKEEFVKLTPEAIEEGVQSLMKNTNSVHHIFNNPKHKLDPLIKKYGSKEAAVRAVLKAADGKLPKNSVFNNIPIAVDNCVVHVRGAMVKEVPRIGTMFIK